MFTGQKMIQAIIPMGTALPVVKALEKGLDAANINFARGVGGSCAANAGSAMTKKIS